MAHEHSYGATRSNNKTENEAVDFLLAENKNFRRPSKVERQIILTKLGLAKSFTRAFDLLLLPAGNTKKSLSNVPIKRLVLIELKTTKKKLPHNPKGFFFGATENEFRLAKLLGNKYKFCFVSLHPESKSYAMVTAPALEKMTKTRRIQFQINLH